MATSGAHGVSRAARAQPMMRSAVRNSASGVKRHAAASPASASAAAAILPQAGRCRLGGEVAAAPVFKSAAAVGGHPGALLAPVVDGRAALGGNGFVAPAEVRG